MSGKKGRSGRQKRSIELARARGYEDCLSYIRRRSNDIITVLVDKAASGDKEACIYCLDRIFGRPRIEVDSRTQGNVEISIDPARYLQALKEARVISAEYRLEGPDGQDRKPEQST